jgi:hypothetical protein
MPKWTLGFLLACLLIGPAQTGALAASATFEFNSNNSVLEGRLGGEWPMKANTFHGGASALYDSDDYAVFALDAAAGNTVLGPDAFFYLGLKGLYGNVEFEPEDADVMSVGFLLGGEYEPYRFRDLPVVLTGHLVGAFGPMNFGDNDGYMEFKTTAGVNFLADRRGGIFIGYRYLSFDFEDDFDQDALNKSEVFFGIRFRY